MSVSKDRKPRSIDEYMRVKRQAGCVVCKKLTPELAQQIKDSMRRRNVSVEVVLEWLKVEHGIVVTMPQWQLHTRGQHK